MSLVTASCRSSPSAREPYSGAKLSFVPNKPVLMVTHSGWPVRSSRYTWPTLPSLAPSASTAVRPSMFCRSWVVVMSYSFSWVVPRGGVVGWPPAPGVRGRRPWWPPAGGGLVAGRAVPAVGVVAVTGGHAVGLTAGTAGAADGVLGLAALVLDGGGIAGRFGDAGLLLVIL